MALVTAVRHLRAAGIPAVYGDASYPSVLRAIGAILPMKYFVELVYAIYLHGERVWSKPGAVAVLVGWGLAGVLVAVRRFRWEPVEG